MARRFADPFPVPPAPCPGPLVWFDVNADDCPRCGDHHGSAVLECAACPYIVTSGNFHDPEHTQTEVLRSPM